MTKLKPSAKFSAGQSLVELLVAIGVAGVMLPALVTGLVASREGKVQQRERLSATALLREAQEAVRIVREHDWTVFALNGTFHPVVSVGTWSLAAGPETVNKFTRSVAIADVYRDAGGAIVSSGGTLDPSTKQVVAAVSWNAIFPSSVTSTVYLTRYKNQNYLQTTLADFSPGTLNNVILTNTSGGEISLGAGGKADWCAPNLSLAALDLPKQGVANAVSAIQGRVFAGTGDNASGISFANVTVSDTDPPVAAIAGTYDGFKTNGIFGETNYAYLATDNNFKEIEIVNLTTTPYTEAGYFDAPGNGNGNSIYVSGNVGYMTDGSNLYTFDLSSRTGPRPKLGQATLPGTGRRVVVVGNYAYVATAAGGEQLDIFDVTDPKNPVKVSQASPNHQSAVDVFVNSSGTRAYLVTAYSTGEANFFVIDTSAKSPLLPPALGSYTTSGMSPKGVTVVTGNKAIIVGTGGSQQYQVVDLNDETAPVHCTSDGRSGGLAIPTGVNGIAAVLEQDGDAYSYIITGDASSELKIIEGGPGGKYAQNGTFTSATFDAGTSAAFNRLNFTATAPPQASVKVQVAGAGAVAGSCADAVFSFVGPDGTANTFFTGGGPIPLSGGSGYKNPARCWRYKVYLSTNDFSQTPIFYDIIFNYSP